MFSTLVMCCWIWLGSAQINSGLENDKTFVPSAILSKLATLIQEDQIENMLATDEQFCMKRLSGLYSTYVKNNFNGRPMTAFWRRMGQFENNIFTTNYINTILLEAHQRGRAPAPTSLQLTKSIELFPDFVNKNKPFNSSIMFFYPSTYDAESDLWHSRLDHCLARAASFSKANGLPIADVMNFLGFPDMAAFVQAQGESIQVLAGVPATPSDFDTSFINVGLGAALFEQRERFLSEWELWSSFNNNLTSVLGALAKYSYRPFSGDRDSSSTDPKTYFAFRKFLDRANDAREDLALVNVWIQNLAELRWQYDKRIGIPGNINTMCVGVTANVVHGITYAILSGLMDVSVLEEPLLAQIYHNSTELMVFTLETNMTGRPDLATFNYPSRVQVEWFISRTLVKLEDAARKGPLPSPLMEFVHRRLKQTFREDTTFRLLNTAKPDLYGTAYYEDFLGTADLTDFGTPMNTGEDRIYSTALAVNVLINSWTYQEPGSKRLLWHADTKEEVKSITSRASKWLVNNSFKFSPGGVAFGTHYFSVNWESPWEFPTNRYEFINGTPINDWTYKPTFSTIVAMEGYVPPENYAAMLEKEWFGKKPRLDFHGYNNNLSPWGFPYWESSELTYSLALLALSQYKNIDW